MPALANPAADPAEPAGRALVAVYSAWLQRRGRGNRCYRDAALHFLQRWPDVIGWENEPLAVKLSADRHTRPFLTFLLLHDRLRPGYDYLVARKFAGLVELAAGTRLQPDLDGFVHAAGELGFAELTQHRAAEGVVARLLIRTGRTLHGLTVEDLGELEAALRHHAAERGTDWGNDPLVLHAAWAVLFHLGVVAVTPPNRRRHDHTDHAHHFGGVPAWLASRLQDYLDALVGTHAVSTRDGIAIRLAHFGRHLTESDPDLDSLAGLDRHRHIESCLAAVARARALGGGQPISVGEQRSRIITLGRFLADIAEWG